MRLADLFDLAGRGAAGVLHGAGRHLEGARPARSEAAELVPLGAQLGDAYGRYSEEREAAGVAGPSPTLMASIENMHWIESGRLRHNGRQPRTPPMIVTVFRSRLMPGLKDEYLALVERMNELAQATPGYISHKGFFAEDGERCTIVEFEHEEGQKAWRTNA